MREPGALALDLRADALGSSPSKMSANDCNVRASKNNKVFCASSGSRQRCERGVRQNTTAVWRFSRGTPKYPPLDHGRLSACSDGYSRRRGHEFPAARRHRPLIDCGLVAAA